MFTSDPHHIIAIGASAGGMEEINTFFDHTPLDGVSYLIVQHLSSDFKSRMVELLARHSKLAVKEAEDGMKIQSNQVYLIPNDKFMTLRGHRLHLTGKEKGQTPHLTINMLFNSLAKDCGKKAIGVILSGLGSDGTEGIKAIKKAGGMVIARDPRTSAFNSMPSNAIATGLVDFVLEPELMPGAIEDYVRYGGEVLPDSTNDEKNINDIVSLMKNKSLHDFSDYKLATILRRTKRRAAQGNFTSLANYYSFLKENPEEVEALAKDFLISVTSFFRDKGAFEYIQKNILPDILKKLAPGEELKMWVAGCATGEEAYSLAILVCELLTGKYKDVIVKIFATDIDSVALATAGKGVYNQGIKKSVPADRLEQHFLKDGNNYKIKPVIRKMVIFAQHDLVKNPPYCNMHFVSCRNLLIYMTPILQKKIFTMLMFGLKLNGYLFLGSSENPGPIIKNLEVVNKKWKLFKNLEVKRSLRFDAFSLPEIIDNKRAPVTLMRDETAKNLPHTLTDTINEALVADTGSLVVCIDAGNNVIKSYGDTTKYLHQKNFKSNLAELLPKPLAVAFSSISNSVLKTNEKASVTGIKIKHGDTKVKVNLSVTPLTNKKGEQKLLLVTFSEDNKGTAAQHEQIAFDENIYHNQYVANIEAELKELKEKLNSAYEQLDASNENMQSFNEELISANEEMQSTNEEMQSVNEELDTINSDYQLKNKELQEINDDLNNYFRSNINGQLFIDNDLRLVRFSPGTVKQINLLETDIGRPLSNISTNIKFETIFDDIKHVLNQGDVITKEIETNNGKWYQIMTMPYLQADNKRTGAIITFNDITELKSAQLELDKKNTALQNINADLDNFVNTVSHDLLAPLANIENSIDVMNHIKVADPKLDKFLKIINSSVKKFRALITDIATIGKIEGDTEMELVDVEEQINNIEWSLEDKIKSSGAVILRDLEVTQIPFSRKNLRSILYNLISNGIKFRGDAPPVVNIHTQKIGNNIITSVRDNGMGMPKEGIDKIFSLYGRLHHEIEGNGIGLYLAKKIVVSAGGDIKVESEPGKGSKFIITLKAEPKQLV